eukprot:gene226-276_t
MTTSIITKIPWVDNYYVGDGMQTLFGVRKASAFTSCPTPTEIRNIKSLKVSQSTIMNQDDYTRALTSTVTASASVASWGVSGETKNSFNYDRVINQNTTHFLINNYYIKSETVFKREQLDALTFSPTALNLIKAKQFDKFVETYGDSFLIGYALGGTYKGDISLTSYSDKNIKDMQASLSAAFSGVTFTASGGVDFTNKLTTFSSQFSINVVVEGTGIALKNIAIGDVSKMIADAGNLEGLGDARLYAILSSYDDLPQFKAAVAAAPVDLQPKVRPQFVTTMNTQYYDLQYAINSQETFKNIFAKNITDSYALTTANNKLTTIIGQLKDYIALFDVLTVKNCENMSAAPATNAKWQNIIKCRPIIAQLDTIANDVGIRKFGTDKQRKLLGDKINLIISYNNNGWDQSPSQAMQTIINDLRADTNAVIDFTTICLESENGAKNQILYDNGPPSPSWSKNDNYVKLCYDNAYASFAEVFISDAERTAVKNHIDQLWTENEVNSGPSPWNIGQSTWLNQWIRRCVASTTCNYFLNCLWWLNSINDIKQFNWQSPDPVIRKFCLVAKYIYNI